MSEPLFDQLDPPPGGLTGLRRRILRDARRQVRRRLMRGSVVVVLLLGLTSWVAVQFRASSDVVSPELDLVRIHLGLLPVSSQVVTIPEAQRSTLAVQRVPLPTDQVVFYRVASIEEGTSGGAAPETLDPE
jgi:hypothetical protein